MTSNLTRVHDMFGSQFLVQTSDLVGTRPLLRTYYGNGNPVPDRIHPELEYVTLHRENICPHPMSAFVIHTALGDSFQVCPTCFAQMEAQIAADLALA